MNTVCKLIFLNLIQTISCRSAVHHNIIKYLPQLYLFIFLLDLSQNDKNSKYILLRVRIYIHFMSFGEINIENEWFEWNFLIEKSKRTFVSFNSLKYWYKNVSISLSISMSYNLLVDIYLTRLKLQSYCLFKWWINDQSIVKMNYFKEKLENVSKFNIFS